MNYDGSFNIDNNAQIIHYNYIHNKDGMLKIKSYRLAVKTKCINVHMCKCMYISGYAYR